MKQDPIGLEHLLGNKEKGCVLLQRD